MELQDQLDELERGGYAVFAISYDPVAVLADFAEKRGVGYWLLSDEGSHVFRRLGLLNEHVAEQHAFYGGTVQPHHQGIPYPGYFVLDERGIVVDKQFEQSYRVRPSGHALVESLLGGERLPPAVGDQAEGQGVRVSAWLDQPAYRSFQTFRLHVAVQIAPGLHVYGEPIQEGLTPLTIVVRPLEGLTVGDVALPPPHPYAIEGFDEQFHVYEGALQLSVPLTIAGNHGDLTLAVDVHYQACTDAICFAPGEVTLELPLRAADLIRD